MNILKSIGCEVFLLIFIHLKLWEILLCVFYYYSVLLVLWKYQLED